MHYLMLPEVPVQGFRLKWHELRKHVPLQDLSSAVYKEWTHVHGGILGYPDGGWQLHWALVPSS